MGVTRVVRHDLELRRLMTSLHGGVAANLYRRAIRVQNHAKLNCTGRAVTGANNPEHRGPRVDTGRLRSSIGINLLVGPGGVFARIGTNVIYGYYLETGLVNGATYPFLKPALPAARE